MISLPKFVQSTQGIPDRLKDVKKKYIIDCDAGSDDAHAIITAIHCAKIIGAQIIGITCVSGNTQLPLVIKNVKIALMIAGESNVPIYAGCDRSLMQEQWMDNFFLADGLSGHQQSYIDRFKIDGDIKQSQHAVQFIIDSIHKYKKELTILVMGPMTNLACALIKDHTIEDDIGTIVFLGGNMCGLGIVENGVAEFNAFTDVEAIHLVYKALQDHIVMIPYETVFTASEEYVNNTFEYSKTHTGTFVKNIYESMFAAIKRYDVQDPLTAIVAMMPQVVNAYAEKKCQIILHGEARGLVAVDWVGVMKSQYKLEGEITIVVGLDMSKILQILHEVVKDDHPSLLL